jgi:hypothetical protein
MLSRQANGSEGEVLASIRLPYPSRRLPALANVHSAEIPYRRAVFANASIAGAKHRSTSFSVNDSVPDDT